MQSTKEKALKDCLTIWTEIVRILKKLPSDESINPEIIKCLVVEVLFPKKEFVQHCPACNYAFYLSKSSQIDCNYCPIEGWNARNSCISFKGEYDFYASAYTLGEALPWAIAIYDKIVFSLEKLQLENLCYLESITEEMRVFL